MDVESGVVVIDNGNGLIKVGFSGEDAPRAVFPTIVGQASKSKKKEGSTRADARAQQYVGSDAQQKREIMALSLRCPMEGGRITDWDNMQKIWEYAFEKQLGLDMGDYKVPVLMTDSPLTPREDREVFRPLHLT